MYPSNHNDSESHSGDCRCGEDDATLFTGSALPDLIDWLYSDVSKLAGACGECGGCVFRHGIDLKTCPRCFPHSFAEAVRRVLKRKEIE